MKISIKKSVQLWPYVSAISETFARFLAVFCMRQLLWLCMHDNGVCDCTNGAMRVITHCNFVSVYNFVKAGRFARATKPYLVSQKLFVQRNCYGCWLYWGHSSAEKKSRFFLFLYKSVYTLVPNGFRFAMRPVYKYVYNVYSHHMINTKRRQPITLLLRSLAFCRIFTCTWKTWFLLHV